ncbi:unnamed protein product [Phytophthora lilii]|uniref:Unnamed protein product n=1 Tax=Phytophthora lilii TaxID=2077276 RepID=A0A9W7CFD0_9STRA|nr:unnamed protein product [Phytophthora lilii]
MQLLLALTQRHLPSTKAEWEAVAEAYNASRDANAKARDSVSLKRKLRSMCRAAHTDSKLASTTRHVQLRTTKKETAKSSSRVLGAPTKPVATVVATMQYAARAGEADAPRGSDGELEESVLVNRSQQLRDLFQQRESDRRAARRHHSEILRSIALLRCAVESFFVCSGY